MMAEPAHNTIKIQYDLVQEIASANDNEAPERYIHENGFPDAAPVADAPWNDQLLIDFSLILSNSAAARAEMKKFRSALESWGCFQVINHGIEVSFLDRVLELCEGFFALPLEEKKRCSGSDNPFAGYGNDAMIAGNNQILNWNDRLYLTLYPEDEASLKYWPQKPENFRDIIGEYGMKLKLIPEVLLKAMASALNLEENIFLQQHGEHGGGLTARVNFYPHCRSPEHVLGVKSHSDGSTLTILLRDKVIQGLEVLKDSQWYKVPVIPGALFVNAGDFAEAMSNGIFKSTVHRVVTNSERDRVSIAVFYSSSSDQEIGPVNALITERRPSLFKKISTKDYGKLFIECYAAGKRTLDALKL